MGNKKQPVETKKRKKKGRPSLLDLQKRSLRLQKQQEEQQQQRNPNPNPNPNPSPNNPYLKFPNRRSTRRNPNPDSDPEEEEEEEEEDDPNATRKEKKLKLVLRIPNGSDAGESGSDSDADGGGSRKKRKIDAVETARQNPNSKATDGGAPPQEDQSDTGPTTALPDKKLLVFILDRLQKKDTYGVFSEPVDPEELPDYHDIIEHPMDFGTVRMKLDSRAYANLEQFESDVFLICSNAMRYNASDTIYFRQARAIHELAKKDFDNLRQESDDNEEEPKPARRGRPPIKHIMKRIGRPSVDRTGSDFSSDATLANARDGAHTSNAAHDLRKGPSLDKPSSTDLRGHVQHRPERNEEYSGSIFKGIPTRNWKKITNIDENRRNTYNHPLQSDSFRESSILTVFDGERKLLTPIGLYTEHAYARSLARFSANMGPIGWGIAAKHIQRVLPPGTKFGPGWVGESEAVSQTHPLVVSSSPHFPSLSIKSHGSTQSGDDKVVQSCEFAPSNSSSSASASTVTTTRPGHSVDASDGSRQVKHEGRGGLMGGLQSGSPLQICQNSKMLQTMNGFNPTHGFGLPLHAVKMTPQTRSPETAMAHGHAPDAVSRNSNSNSLRDHQRFHAEPNAGERTVSAVGSLNGVGALPDAIHSSEGQLRGSPLNPKPGSVPPDLNVDFQSPNSPVSGLLAADSKKQQQPDLALQL